MGEQNLRGISRNKQQILGILRAIGRFVEIIVSPRTLIKGTVYEQKKKCGNQNCKCARGELHRAKILSFSEERRTRLIPLTKYTAIELSKINRQVKEYQQFRRARAEIVRYFKLMVTGINKLEGNLLIEILPVKGVQNGRGKKGKGR